MTDLSPDFAEAWERFKASQSLRLLQQTQEWEWTRGRADYAAFLFAVSDEAARNHITSRIAQVSSTPGVDPYPEHYWHVTVKGVGFVCDEPWRPDEVSREGLEQLAEDARAALEAVPCFDVTLGLPNAFEEVVFMEVYDGGIVRSLNQRLIETLPGLARYPIDGDAFLPHISIARFDSDEGLAELKGTLAAMRDEGAGPSFRVHDMMLIQAHLTAEAPEFEMVALYNLAGD